MGILFIPMFIAGIVMMVKSPDLLKKRLNAKEKENEQKQVVALSGLMFLAGFIIAGINYRYSWIVIPNIVVIISSIISTAFKKPSTICNLSFAFPKSNLVRRRITSFW